MIHKVVYMNFILCATVPLYLQTPSRSLTSRYPVCGLIHSNPLSHLPYPHQGPPHSSFSCLAQVWQQPHSSRCVPPVQTGSSHSGPTWQGRHERDIHRVSTMAKTNTKTHAGSVVGIFDTISKEATTKFTLRS